MLMFSAPLVSQPVILFLSLTVHSVNHIEALLTDQYGGPPYDDFASYYSDFDVELVFVAVKCVFSNSLNVPDKSW